MTILLPLIPVFISSWITLPEYKSNSQQNLITIQLKHPINLSAEETERDLTRVMENLLMDVPGLEKIQSETSAGLCYINIFVDTEDVTETISWIHREVRIHRSQFPDGLNAPIIISDKPSVELLLTGPFVGATAIINDLVYFLRMKGRNVVTTQDSLQVIYNIRTEFERFYHGATTSRNTHQHNGYTYTFPANTFYRDEVARPKTVVCRPGIIQPNESTYLNGQPAVPIEILGSRSRLRSELKKWPGFSRYGDYIIWDDPPSFIDLPFIRVILVSSILYLVFSRSKPTGTIIWSAVSSLLLGLLFLSESIETANLISTAAVFIPLVVLKASPSPVMKYSYTSLFAFIFFIITLFIFSDTLVKDIPRSTSWAIFDKHTKVSAWGVSINNYSTGVTTHLLEELKKLGQPFLLKRHRGNIEASITPATLSAQKIRATLVRQAINSSGFHWYIDTPGQADFTTFPQPVYPSEQWTISGPDYSNLLRLGQILLRRLKLFPGVYNARIFSSQQVQKPEEYQLNNPSALESIVLEPPVDLSELYDGVYSGERTFRGRDIFTITQPETRSIRKNNRAYVLTIGHEFKGSRQARARLENEIRTLLNGQLGEFEKLKLDDTKETAIQDIARKLILLSIPIFLILTLISPDYLLRLTQICKALGSALLCLILASVLEIGLPVSPEPFACLMFGIQLIQVLNNCHLRNVLIWTCLTVLTCLWLFPSAVGWTLLSGGVFCLSHLIHRGLRLISRVFSPLPLWRDLQFSRRN